MVVLQCTSTGLVAVSLVGTNSPHCTSENMSKKKNRQAPQNVVSSNFQDEFYVAPPREVANRIQYPVPVPHPINMDEIAVMADDQLYSLQQQLESDRQKVLDYRLDPYFWEVELAYLRRELNIRRVRRDAHEAYLQKNAALFMEEEYFLPEYEEYNDGKRQSAPN